jgi:hypothetical protein
MFPIIFVDKTVKKTISFKDFYSFKRTTKPLRGLLLKNHISSVNLLSEFGSK